MPWASKTHTFSPSTVAKSAEVNDNFDDMVDQLNIACPSGLIALWSGSIASIPSGWYLCDGNNSTPDLRDKFVAGAGSSYAVGDTGGEATHVLTIAEMPVHNHVVTGGTAGGSGHVRRDALNNSNHTTNSSGSGSAHENRPPYYALAYIMKS